MIEADLHRYYGIDLLDLWRGQLSLRKLNVLVAQLPPDSNTGYALASHDTPVDHLRGWTLPDLLLARLLDELAIYRWQWEAAHIDPKKTRHRPEPDRLTPQPQRAQAPDLRVVSPHELGSFVNKPPEEVTDGH